MKVKNNKKLNQINKPLKAILLTHAHYDHIGALDNIIEKYQVPVYMSKDEFDFLTDPDKMAHLNLHNMVYLK